MSASSFGVMAVQLGYAAVTSRLLPPSAFGAYAVALSGVGLIGMLGGSSLGQSAARRDHDSVHLDRSLVTLAIITGGTTGLVAFLLAPLWGQLWGVPDSVPVTRVLALGIPLTALAAVLAGILRRSGRTSAVAGRTAIGQLTGMAIGLAAVLSMETAWSLGVASVAGSVVTGVLLAASLPRERLVPTRPTSASVDDAIYGAKSAGMNLLRYSTNLIAPWSIGRFAGAAALGGYNRATTLLTGPMETLQRAFSYSLFPELRPGGPSSRSGRALTDIVILVSWPAVALAGLGMFAAPPLLAVLLGPGWEEAQAIAGAALLLGVLPMLSAPLSSSLEARGEFRITLIAWLAGTAIVALGAYRTFETGDIRPATYGLLGSVVLRSAFYLIVLAVWGRVSIGRIWLGAWPMVATQTAATGPLLYLSEAFSDEPMLLLAAISVVGAMELSLLWLVRRRTAFWTVGLDRGLPGFR